MSRTIACLLATTILAVPAHAETVAGATAEAETDAGSIEQSDPIVVVGQRDEYGVRRTSTGTKTDTDVRDIPQALTVISESQIEDQSLRSIADILYFVPGATPGTGEGNRDQVTLRGNNTTADFFIDGVRDDVQYSRDLYNVDRVEVLRGSNAMIFGRGGGGGVVNRVTKRSSLQPFREFSVAGDSEGGFRLTGDVDQPLAPEVGLRINGMYENGESFRRHTELERYGVNPTIGIQAGADTRIDLSYEYLHDRRTTDRGVPSFSDGNAATLDEPLEHFDRTFFGDPDASYARADVHIATFAIEHRLSEQVTLRNRTLYGNYDKFYQNVFPNAAVNASEVVRLSAYNNNDDRTNLISQTDLIWKGSLGGIDQTILVGAELGRQKSESRRRNGFFQPSNLAFLDVPLDDPTIDADVIFRPLNANGTAANFNRTKASIAAFYVQDQVHLSDQFELVAGLRFDHFSLDATNLNTDIEFDRTDSLWSPRIGLIFKPLPNLSLYAAYSRSYLPQSGDQFSSLDVTTEALKPEKFDNYELGAKWEPVPGLLATAAIYRLDRTNTRAPNPDPSGPILLTGAQRSRGLEIGLERSVNDRWQISGGYAFQKAEVRKVTSACLSGDCELPLVPRHTFSLWNRYDVTDTLGLGLGVIARSKSFASISNTVKLPGYVRADAALFYEVNRKIEAQLNVENILNADYFPNAHSDNNIAPGAPRTARATLRFKI